MEFFFLRRESKRIDFKENPKIIINLFFHGYGNCYKF
jgi:hypothetical protein